MLMNKQNYLKAWNRAHKSYEKKVYNIFIQYFRNQAKNIPFDLLDADNYNSQIKNSIKIYDLYNTYYKAYDVIGLIHGNRIGKGINKELKEFNTAIFATEYQRNLYNWILDSVGYRIVSVHSGFIEYIQNIIAKGIIEGKTVMDISIEIQKLINNRSFYRWQALRIARTETTAAANRAAIIAGTTSGIVLDKIWISGNDARVRRNPPSRFDHLRMNNVKVPKDEYFNVNGELIEYPGALVTKEGNKSSGGNVIQCRCTVALIPRRDSNGRIIRI